MVTPKDILATRYRRAKSSEPEIDPDRGAAGGAALKAALKGKTASARAKRAKLRAY